MSKSSMFSYFPLSPPFTFIVTCLFNKLLCDAFGAQLKYLNIFFIAGLCQFKLLPVC